MQLSCIVFGILKQEVVQAWNLIPKWHLSSLGKNQTKDVCQKCLMMGKMSLQCLSEEQADCAEPVSEPIKWGCTAPGWQRCRLGVPMRQPGISLSPDLAFDLSSFPTSASSSIASRVYTQQISSANKVLYRSFRGETADGPLL